MKRKLNKPSHRKLLIPFDSATRGMPVTEDEKKCYKSVAYQGKATSFLELFAGMNHVKVEEQEDR